MRIGIDIVDIDDFRDQLSKTSGGLAKKLFSASELSDRSTQSLAGIFAAKEAIIKTGLFTKGEWLKIKLANDADGKPKLRNKLQAGTKLDISISHTEKTAVAVAILHS
ncbi:MAG: holo-ACP synthase [Candidatus Dojkabacteria bacterium]